MAPSGDNQHYKPLEGPRVRVYIRFKEVITPQFIILIKFLTASL